MKSVKKWIVAVLLLLSSNNCSREEFPFNERGLTYKGQFVYNSQFRMDGIWYSVDVYGLHVRYFFKDGTFFSGDVVDFNINNVQCWQIPSRDREIPWHWGFFIVVGDTIKIQTFNPMSRNWSRRFQVREFWARIENDTTIPRP